MITRVKDLIEELRLLDQEAVVLYAYNEYGRTGIHSQIATDRLICLDSDFNFKFDVDGDLIVRYIDDSDDEYVEGYVPSMDDPTVTWSPAIELFCD